MVDHIEKRNLSIAFHVVFWITAYLVWLCLTTANHPNWTLRFLCTLVLVGASAIYTCYFSPRSARWNRPATSVFMLVVSGFFAALVIHGLYDWSIGPDPRRFPFLTNLWMDTVIVAFNSLIAALFAGCVYLVFRRNVWSIR